MGQNKKEHEQLQLFTENDESNILTFKERIQKAILKNSENVLKNEKRIKNNEYYRKLNYIKKYKQRGTI